MTKDQGLDGANRAEASEAVSENAEARVAERHESYVRCDGEVVYVSTCESEGGGKRERNMPPLTSRVA